MKTYHICIADIPTLLPDAKYVDIDFGDGIDPKDGVYMVENLSPLDMTVLVLAGAYVVDLNKLYDSSNPTGMKYLPRSVRVAYNSLTV